MFKPAELVPGSAWALAEILSRSGLPAGAFNLVMGRGAVVGQALVEDPRVAGISFTGSVGTGQQLARACVPRGAKFQLEMGGKNPMVVLDDADLDMAVNCAVQSAFFSTGQRCTAASRLIVTEGIHDRFVDAVVARLRQLRISNARSAGTDIGPVVDERKLGIDLQYIAAAKSEGAHLAFGGEAFGHDAQGHLGFYLQPALFTGTHNNMRISREEVFGPAANVIRVRDYEEALSIVNGTPFGLSSGIATTSLKYATHYKRHAQAGMVMVNVPTVGGGLPRALWRAQRIEHGAARAGAARCRVLHHDQNCIHRTINHTDDLDRAFTQARTHSAFKPDAIPDATLQQLQ